MATRRNNLSGVRFGKLLVLHKVRHADGKARWRCVCDCGQHEDLRSTQLTGNEAVRACQACRYARVCEVCSKPFQSQQYRLTCSDACQTLKKRAIDVARYHSRMAQNPHHNIDINAARRARAAADPAYAQRLREQRAAADKRKKDRIRADEQKMERVREAARLRYAENKPLILEQRKARRDARIAAMTYAEYEQWREHIRAYDARRARQVRSTPEGRARYDASMREMRRQQALRELMHTGAELLKKDKP